MNEKVQKFEKDQFDEMLLKDKQKLFDLIKNEKIKNLYIVYLL